MKLYQYVEFFSPDRHVLTANYLLMYFFNEDFIEGGAHSRHVSVTVEDGMGSVIFTNKKTSDVYAEEMVVDSMDYLEDLRERIKVYLEVSDVERSKNS